MLNLYREKSRVGILVKCLRENYRLFNAVEIKVFKGGINMKTFLGFTTGIFIGIGAEIIWIVLYALLMSENENKKA